jgi:tetratricopeptide (TPR) repeat protein
MKNGLIFLLLFAFGNAWAQAGRGTASANGAAPLPANDKGTIRALVVGISEYADSGIVDLRYAHRDAEIFAEYLHSAAGAGLPSENVRLLTNGQATLAAIDDGLNWLISDTKKGDRVIVYFSGHGDVEKQTLWQRGYLLAHNTPGHNYRNNAVKVEDLDEIVKTLSISNEARVTVILDACRSGKLANIGPTLTAEQLEKQVENEVRILSCKPDQRSLEGEGWGQGRGLFSFFLVNGLMGLADAGSFPDGIITLDELTSFVKSGMQQVLSDPSFNSRQNPVFVGDENFEVGEVNDKLLASVKNMDMVAMASPGMKGVVEKGGDTAAVTIVIETFEPPSEVDAFRAYFNSANLGELVVDDAFPKLLASQSGDAIDQFFIEKIAERIRTDQADCEAKKTMLVDSKLDSLIGDSIFQQKFYGLLSDGFIRDFWDNLAPEKHPKSKLFRQEKYYRLTKNNAFYGLYNQGNTKESLRYVYEHLTTALGQEIDDNTRQTALLEQLAAKFNDPAQRQAYQLQLAIALHDQAQEAINAYLRGDPGSLDKRHYKDQAEKYVMYPRMLESALALLPQGHLLRQRCEVKLHYFDGVCTRLASAMSDDPLSRFPEAMAKQHRAMALDDKAAYIHNELGLLHLNLGQLDSALFYFKNAAELAPSWSFPPTNLCTVYGELGQYDKAEEAGNRAISLQPDFFGSYLNLGSVVEKQHDLLRAETLYRKARSLNDPHYMPYKRRAELALKTGRYEEAEWYFYEMELRLKGIVPPARGEIFAMGPTIPFTEQFEYPSLSGPGKVYKNPKTAQDYFMTGKWHYEQLDFVAAEPYFKQAMRLDPKHKEVFYYLADICHKQQRYGEAEVYFLRLMPLRPEVEFMPFFLADVYHDWGVTHKEEAIYKSFIKRSHDRLILWHAFERLTQLMDKQQRYAEEELTMWEAYWRPELNQSFQFKLGLFYSKMTNLETNDPDWRYRHAMFVYDYEGHRHGVHYLEKLLELDSNFSARPFIHALAGRYYLNEGAKKLYSELESKRLGELPDAIHHLRQAVRLLNSNLGQGEKTARYDLAQGLGRLNEYEETLAVLEPLHDSNDLDFASHLLLADLLTRSGRFEEAKQMLDKAVDIQPEPVAPLSRLLGQYEMLHGDPKIAIQHFEKEYELAKAEFDLSGKEIYVPDKRREGEAMKYEEITLTAYTLARLHALLGDEGMAIIWLGEAVKFGFDSKLVLKYDAYFEPYKHLPKFGDLYGGIKPKN